MYSNTGAKCKCTDMKQNKSTWLLRLIDGIFCFRCRDKLTQLRKRRRIKTNNNNSSRKVNANGLS